jgi:malate dehydrogenase (oxaloacetate-decarboxylating)
MFMAAARAIAGMVNPWELGAPILPPISGVREVSVRVAIAVAEQAVREGLARVTPANVEAAVRSAMWEPRYRPTRAV